jgi:Protein kinase domain
MSVVYLAEDTRLKRKVALKVLASGLAADEGFRDRFLGESELAASLDHANVIPIYEAGESGGLLFIAMRYVDGSDLTRLLEDGPLPPARALALAAQVAAALDAAHARGLVHGDVKPSNVLVDRADHAYLADFGLTRPAHEAHAPQPGLQGTVDYVAPEQIEGREVDGRADAYSLGCLLHECLTGVPPFPHDSDVATLFAHLQTAPPGPHPLEQVLPRALAKDPADRYASSSEMVEAARQAFGLAARQRRRWPLVAGAGGIAIVSAVALVLTLGGSSPAPKRDALLRLDATSGRIVGRFPAGDQLSAVATARGVTWATDSAGASLIRLQPPSSQAQAVPAQGTPYGVAADGRFVVTANGNNGTVAVFDAPSGRLRTIVHVSGSGLQAVCDVAIEGSTGWATDCLNHRVVEFDAVSGRVLRTVRLTPRTDDEATVDRLFAGVAIGAGSVWVAGDALDPTLYRIERTSRLVRARIPVPAGTVAVAFGAGAVWLANQLTDEVIRVDPQRNRVTARIAVGREPLSLAIGGGSVWTANALDESISRVAASGNGEPETLRLDATPVGISVAGNDVWVATSRR